MNQKDFVSDSSTPSSMYISLGLMFCCYWSLFIHLSLKREAECTNHGNHQLCPNGLHSHTLRLLFFLCRFSSTSFLRAVGRERRWPEAVIE